MNILTQTEDQYKKSAVLDIRSGDTVAVHQLIKEGTKERLQIFEGLVIRVDRRRSLTYRITVRKITSGVAAEKGFMMHSPNISKVVILKRAKVRRNYISYIRHLTGKSSRLKPRDFDKKTANQLPTTKVKTPTVKKTSTKVSKDKDAVKTTQEQTKNQKSIPKEPPPKPSSTRS